MNRQFYIYLGGELVGQKWEFSEPFKDVDWAIYKVFVEAMKSAPLDVKIDTLVVLVFREWDIAKKTWRECTFRCTYGTFSFARMPESARVCFFRFLCNEMDDRLANSPPHSLIERPESLLDKYLAHYKQFFPEDKEKTI